MNRSAFAKCAKRFLSVGMLGIGSAMLAFLAAQALFTPNEGRAQVPSKVTAQEARSRHQLDYAKPRFQGHMNGFTFYNTSTADHNALMTRWSQKCTQTNVREVTEAVGMASPLGFIATYLPPGFSQNYVAVSACEDDVIAFSRAYRGLAGAMAQVYRKAGPPSFQVGNFPADRLEARTVGGREGLIAHPLVPNGRTTIYLRDGISGFMVSGFQMSLDELIRIAEGVR